MKLYLICFINAIITIYKVIPSHLLPMISHDFSIYHDWTWLNTPLFRSFFPRGQLRSLRDALALCAAEPLRQRAAGRVSGAPRGPRGAQNGRATGGDDGNPIENAMFCRKNHGETGRFQQQHVNVLRCQGK